MNKISEFHNFLTEHNTDACLDTETHAGTNNTLKIPNYNTYKSDRLRYRGAIFVKRYIPSSLYRAYNDDGIQETNVIIEIDGNPIHLSAVYSHPDNKITLKLIKFISLYMYYVTKKQTYFTQK